MSCDDFIRLYSHCHLPAYSHFTAVWQPPQPQQRHRPVSHLRVAFTRLLPMLSSFPSIALHCSLPLLRLPLQQRPPGAA